MKKYLFACLCLLSMALFAHTQQFQMAQPVCGHQQLIMSSTQGRFALFSYAKQINQQDTAEIGKDLYILSRNTPFHIFEEPVLKNEEKQLLDTYQDYQRHKIIQEGEQEFFLFITRASVNRTHLDSDCPAKGSWYALQLEGIKVEGNKDLSKALRAQNWKEELQKVLARNKFRPYLVILEPLCADQYGGENCIFVMK